MSRLSLTMTMNEDFAKALARGEKWAIERGVQIEQIDNPTVRHPERVFDGTKRHHCSNCPFPEGCVCCDLD